MKALDRKLLRDMKRIWPQTLATALVMACGVATMILGQSTYLSLSETRAAYYERYRFGEIFALATRAPNRLVPAIAALDGVTAVQARIAKSVLLDIPGMSEPGTGIALSLPADASPAVNALTLRTGRLPESGAAREVTINEGFAQAHRLSPGDRFGGLINGARVELQVVGIALSPEYVYALGPGDMMPDNRRFGVLWMSEKALAQSFDMEGAFNSVSVTLLRGVSPEPVIEALDDLLRPFGGTGAFERKDQQSNAFLDGELKQLEAMSRILPPIFLVVAAFLVNMILSRMIALEREQIGLLNAIGYSHVSVGLHYAKLVLAIALVGSVVGVGAGTWLGHGMTRLYTEFFAFPFLIYQYDPGVYLTGTVVCIASAALGAARSLLSILALPAAEAMRPPTPQVYRQLVVHRLRLLSQLTVMGLRHLVRHPVRAALTSAGMGLSVGLMVVTLGSLDSINYMIDVLFFRADRQDASVAFVSPASPSALLAVERLPGVILAEPFHVESARLVNGRYARDLQIVGSRPGAELSRVLDMDLKPVDPPSAGIALSERVAGILRLRAGDLVEVRFLEGRRRTVLLPVSRIVQSLVGLTVFMDIDALTEAAGEGPRLSGVHLAIDQGRLNDLYDAVKRTPKLASISLQDISRQRFTETMQRNMTISLTMFLALSGIIAIGVIYNSMRIQLSERARELATLRVIGFSRFEVWWVIMVELAVVILVAQPLGWIAGYGLSVIMLKAFESDLFRVPLFVLPASYALASLVAVAAAVWSSGIVKRRIDRFDLVQVLKTRD